MVSLDISLSDDDEDPRKWIVIIFDWDDTILPTTSLRRLGFVGGAGRPADKFESDISDDMRAELDEASMEAKLTLEMAAEVGSVVIITNGSFEWIPQSCKSFMPNLWEYIVHVPRLSAKELVQPHVINPIDWKRAAFSQHVDRHFSSYPSDGLRTVVSIGDSPHERMAALELAASYPNLRAKSLQLVKLPTARQIIEQHKQLRRFLRLFVEFDEDFADLKFEAIGSA